MNKPRPIELLAPARNAEIAIEAIKHGADAVYMGASSHGARSAAANDLTDIARVAEFAHRFRAKVYVTLNTLVYDRELRLVKLLVGQLYRAGVDALIVQDMSLLRLDLPPIALHASTQCDIRSVDKARFLADVGFSQLVVPREMTLAEMSALHQAVPEAALEAFVHGALCVSYSGDCQAGFASQRRSANRGECPQICRHRFDLVDATGRRLIEGRHLLSLRDLNRSAHIAAMLEAGISSFKIEGRLKDAVYVKNTVAAYRRIIDRAIEERPDAYVRASIGRSEITFEPDLTESFNRGFTSYFTVAARPTEKMASMATPKWTGNPVGSVVTASGRRIVAHLDREIANGDGLGYFDSEGRFCGFRVNRAEGRTLFAASEVGTPAPGTKLYRNHNRLWDERLTAESARRRIDIDMVLRPTPWGFALDTSDRHGHHASAAMEAPHTPARTPQADTHRKALTKTGDTDFAVASVDDRAEELFVPLSQLTSLRRQALDGLRRVIAATHITDRRRPENREARLPGDGRLTYHDNVANDVARRFYTDHGATAIEPALETSTRPMPAEGVTVMTTRYCLRRETGHCRLTEAGAEWPAELYLESGPDRYRLQFDCRNCRMHLVTARKC